MEYGVSVTETVSQFRISDMIRSSQLDKFLEVPVLTEEQLFGLDLYRTAINRRRSEARGAHMNVTDESLGLTSASSIYYTLPFGDSTLSPYCSAAEGKLSEPGWNQLSTSPELEVNTAVSTHRYFKYNQTARVFTRTGEGNVIFKTQWKLLQSTNETGITKIADSWFITSPVIIGCYYDSRGVKPVYDLFDRPHRPAHDRPAGPVLLIRAAENLMPFTQAVLARQLKRRS
ncbi:MAG: hypothetical protein TR69_WS6001000075 [candidate division WS6 bacterium OLB20]|uniref:Uncharacterized protein n=1 Tax=candidate division WS6 bacterium OLB20 TaxID=1617426 RepID=A0A136M157_9BACT|nr:MAG: hypothetical protein TR69_WS6001000075 [candidate division WS6 bacterium OLB20]